MTTLQALFDDGVAAHRAGRLADACAAYEAMLARDPGNFDALHMLGVAAVQSGEAERGAALIEQATRIAPDVAAAHVNLAMALSALGRHDAALSSTKQALAIDAANADAHVNRGNALLALGRAAQALAAYERALALRPADPKGHYNRANALRDLGRLEDAVAAYDAAIALSPGYVEALSNRGAVLARLARLDEALASFDAVLSLRATAEAHRNRGAVLARLRRLEDAVASYDAALSADPASAQAHNDRAGALNDLGRAADALAAADRAIALDPDLADAHNNRGIALYTHRRLDEALACYEQALAIEPEAAEPHVNRALARLLAGDLAGGFAEYRWRWRVAGAQRERPAVACPDWEGERLAGRRLLVFAEQGYGDSLQFVRFVPRAAALGACVTLLVEPPLVRLLGASLPGVEVVGRLPEDAVFDRQAAMLCLPRLLGVTLDTVAADMPYLAADPAAAAAWARRLAAIPGRKVGLVWAGASRRDNPSAAAVDARRSLRLAQLAPLAAVPGVQFVSLQVGEPASQAREPPSGLPLIDWTAELGDFADTAALVAGLDLVVTVDTAVAHLAGALGRPVWILSRFDGCWRWLQDRDDSPWHPTARLFRQPAPGDWASVIAAVAGALSA
jgi:tetratricopeptide (TPR) repeat protein